MDDTNGAPLQHSPPGALLQATLNLVPAYAWYAAPSGALRFVNERSADYGGLPKDHPLRFGAGAGEDGYRKLRGAGNENYGCDQRSFSRALAV